MPSPLRPLRSRITIPYVRWMGHGTNTGGRMTRKGMLEATNDLTNAVISMIRAKAVTDKHWARFDRAVDVLVIVAKREAAQEAK